MRKEAGEKKIVRVGPNREGSAGFLKMLSVLAGIGTVSKFFRMPKFAEANQSRMRRSSRVAPGAFGSSCGSKTRLGGYKFPKI